MWSRKHQPHDLQHPSRPHLPRPRTQRAQISPSRRTTGLEKVGNSLSGRQPLSRHSGEVFQHTIPPASVDTSEESPGKSDDHSIHQSDEAHRVGHQLQQT